MKPIYKTIAYIAFIFFVLVIFIINSAGTQGVIIAGVITIGIIGISAIGYIIRYMTNIKLLYFLPHGLLTLTIPYWIYEINQTSGLAGLGPFLILVTIIVVVVLSIPLYYFTMSKTKPQ